MQKENKDNEIVSKLIDWSINTFKSFFAPILPSDDDDDEEEEVKKVNIP